jgi:phosphate transport system protein
MRTEYHAALDKTSLGVIQLGALAEDGVRCSFRALERRDQPLAERVISGAEGIQALRRNLEAACMELIWRQQPVAGELRQVAGMLQIGTDLERVNSYAVEIAKAALRLVAVSELPAASEIRTLAELAQAMIADALVAYRDGSIALTEAVTAREEELDEAYQRAISALEAAMQADPTAVSAGSALLLVVANAERVADRAENIAWKTQDIYAR